MGKGFRIFLKCGIYWGMMSLSCGVPENMLEGKDFKDDKNEDLQSEDLQNNNGNEYTLKVQKILSEAWERINETKEKFKIFSINDQKADAEDMSVRFDSESLWTHLYLTCEAIKNGVIVLEELPPKEYFLDEKDKKYKEEYRKWAEDLILKYIYKDQEAFAAAKRNPDKTWNDRRSIFGNLEFYVACYGLVLVYTVERNTQLSDEEKFKCIKEIIETFKEVYCNVFEKISGINLNERDPREPLEKITYFDRILNSPEKYINSIYSYTINQGSDNEQKIDFKVVIGIPIWLIENLILVGVNPIDPKMPITMKTRCYFDKLTTPKELNTNEDFSNSVILINVANATVNYINYVIRKIREKAFTVVFDDQWMNKFTTSNMLFSDFRYLDQNIDDIVIIDKILKLEDYLGWNEESSTKQIRVSFIINNPYVRRNEKGTYTATFPKNNKVFDTGNELLEKYLNFDQKTIINKTICGMLTKNKQNNNNNNDPSIITDVYIIK